MTITPEPAPTSRRFLVALPLLFFLALAGLLFFRLLALAGFLFFHLGSGDPSRLPSALIGKPAPALSLAALDGLLRDGKPVPGLDPAQFKGQVTIVNVWASWCVPCLSEHPQLMRLAADGRTLLVGINYKDASENARRFLGRHGNPFAAVGVDPDGRSAIEWGVYGVPETFLIGRNGRIAYKLVGPITDETLPQLEREIQKALGES
ncbi:MAG TPA: DsbE family thiol:disulfide interchange protein [Xanthobacteraceae bacterium]|nr:DsbE family thiol:disulfide interchange protein [Xanthobacteraceae bacterium]